MEDKLMVKYFLSQMDEISARVAVMNRFIELGGFDAQVIKLIWIDWEKFRFFINISNIS